MIKSKQARDIVCGLMMVTNCLMFGTAFAEVSTIEADGYYQMRDGLEENQAIAKERAKVDAMRCASEQAAVYIESNSKVSLGRLTKDEVQLLSSAILQVKSVKYHPVVVGDSIQYRCHIVALVDTDSVKGRVQNGRLELEDSLRRYQEENERLRKEMEELKQRYQIASETQKQQLRVDEQKNNQDFLANQYFGQGLDLQKKKDYYGALKAYSKAINIKPDSVDVYNNMGVVYYKLGQNDKAIKQYEKAIALKTDFADVYCNMGNVYYKIGQQEKAIKLYEKATALRPDFATAYNNMGVAYYKLGQNEKAISLKSDYADPYCNIGNIYYKLGQKEKAIKMYEKTLTINPDDATAYYYMGVAYYDLGNKGKAKECFQKAYRLAPNNEIFRRAATGK